MVRYIEHLTIKQKLATSESLARPTNCRLTNAHLIDYIDIL
jgi:hypothetical protein